jgi:hypothetical protein
MHEQNCFVTLTYDDEHLPDYGSLHRPDIQKFLKRLRKKVGKLRTFYCGEYGDQLERPHFHALIFGYEPSDKTPSGKSKSGDQLYESDIITDTWGKGHANLGDLTFESAAYVARYVTKKITGDLADDHYSRIDEETGEIVKLVPEFLGFSNRPGIGYEYAEKWLNDIYSKDQVYVNGKVMMPPKYYDRVCQKLSPSLWEKVYAKRMENFHPEWEIETKATGLVTQTIGIKDASRNEQSREATFNLFKAKTEIQKARSHKRNL